MKRDQDKWHFLSTFKMTPNLSLRDCLITWELKFWKTSRLIIQRKLNFNEDLTNLYNKASKGAYIKNVGGV